MISKHFNEIGKNLDLLLSKYDNFMLIGDLNAEPTEATVSDFCEIYNLKHLIKDKTCFKNPTKPTCIDLIITNRPKCFQDSVVIETGLSDFHKMSATVMKMYYTKQKPSIVRYRKFKNFCNDSFIKDIELLLSKLCHQQNVPFKILKESVNITLDKHAPLKQRYVRANQSPFMNKKLSKEIMKRSRLRNKFLNTKSDIDRKAYNKQRNYVVNLLRNEKNNFYSSLDTKVVTDKLQLISQIHIEEVKKSFQSLDPKRAARKDDIKTNLLKKNIDFFAKYTCDDINDSIRSSKFPNELKQADIVPAHKKSQSFLRKIIDLLAFSQMFLRFMKDAYRIN